MEASSTQHSIGSPLAWVAFVVLVLVLVALDLGVLHRRARDVSTREAAVWSVFWLVLAAGFALATWGFAGSSRALEFTTGYLIEKALALDNLFVIFLIFAYLQIPRKHQHRVLVGGIIGAMLLRAAFIASGTLLIARFEWLLYVLGALLVVAAIRLAFDGLTKASEDAESRPPPRALRWLEQRLPITAHLHGQRFLTRVDDHTRGTPLLLALLMVESCDVAFAFDSIPAIFAITLDPFVVFTSNILAVLGLRSLFFLFSRLVGKLKYLRHGLASVLVVVGLKLLLRDFVHVPAWGALLATMLPLLVAIVASLLSRDSGGNAGFLQPSSERAAERPRTPNLPSDAGAR